MPAPKILRRWHYSSQRKRTRHDDSLTSSGNYEVAVECREDINSGLQETSEPQKRLVGEFFVFLFS